MSETPERKVLKEMLGKLKAKTIKSDQRHQESLLGLDTAKGEVYEALIKLLESKRLDVDVAGYLGFMVRRLYSAIDTSLAYSTMVREDFKLYIDTLERYSTELDKTLIGIFERAIKMAEEELKKQEELRKRKPSGMTV